MSDVARVPQVEVPTAVHLCDSLTAGRDLPSYNVRRGVFDEGIERKTLPRDLHLATRKCVRPKTDNASTGEQDVSRWQDDRGPCRSEGLGRYERVVLSIPDVRIKGVAGLGCEDRPEASLWRREDDELRMVDCARR